MKRILSSVGIGSAEVDLVLSDTTVTQGETVDADVEVIGGNTEQEVEEIYYAILTKYSADDTRRTGVIDEGTLVDGFTVDAGEERSIDVALDIPPATPVTMGGASVWIETGLDIEWAVDPDDHDDLQVQPDERTRDLLEAMEALGFRYDSAKNVADEHGQLTTEYNFVQEFEFKPRTGEYVGELDELEIVPLPDDDHVEFVVEIDRDADALVEMAGADETITTVTFEGVDEEDKLAEKFRDAIDRKL
ncbi:sporulation protein [Halorientalis pallida]|uniref:sporulation protein n=1 Tax=Halorientalis pallida TaxID=2479928 RepID=UPI003C6EAACE